jgi:hypothetical protein
MPVSLNLAVGVEIKSIELFAIAELDINVNTKNRNLFIIVNK